MSKSGGKIFLAGLFGAMAGAIGGLLLAPKAGKETREEISKLAKDISKRIKTEASDTRERVKEVFGNAGNAAMVKYGDVRQAVVDKVAQVKSAGQEIDKDKYQLIVEDVISEYKGELELTKESITKLSNMLKKDWTKFKKAIGSTKSVVSSNSDRQ